MWRDVQQRGETARLEFRHDRNPSETRPRDHAAVEGCTSTGSSTSNVGNLAGGGV